MHLVGKLRSISDADNDGNCVVEIRYHIVRIYRAWCDENMAHHINKAWNNANFWLFAYVHDLEFTIDDTTHEVLDVEVVM